MPPRNARGAMLKPRLDLNLPPIKKLSLRQWNQKFLELSAEPDLVARDTFALTGRYTSVRDQRPFRAGFDSSDCRLAPGLNVAQVCDIDSVIGIIPGHFPVADNATFKYYMLPNPTYTLTSSLHIPGVVVRGQNGEEERVPIDKIPNARFGEMGDHFLVRVFFPGLREDNRSNAIGQHPLELFYDKAVLPATVDVIPNDLRRTWPATFKDEKWRATRTTAEAGAGEEGWGAAPQQTGREVHAQHLNPWLDAIRAKVGEDPELAFARGFFLVVEQKGVKNRNGNHHQPPERPLANAAGEMLDQRNPRTQAIKDLLSDFDTTLFEPGCWYLDIATTLSVSEDEGDHQLCAFALASAHPAMINHFTGYDIGQCARWVERNGGGYQRDEVAHLGDIAGFRIALREPGAHGVYYVQVYSTEKSVVYHIGPGQNAKRTSPLKILTNFEGEKISHFIPLQSAFIDAAATHSVALRIESRVAFEGYPHVHLAIDIRTLQPWLAQMNGSAFWGWKKNRLMAIHNTLSRLCEARALYTMHHLPQTGSLLVLLVWMANALVNRPDDGGNWDEVRDSGCIHVERDGKVLPYRPCVFYYLHSLIFARLVPPRISTHRTVSEDTVLYLCGTARHPMTALGLFRSFTGGPLPAIAQQPQGDPWGTEEAPLQIERMPRQANRQVLVTTGLAEEVEDAFLDAIPEPPRDARHASEELDPEERRMAPPLSRQVTDIVYTLAVQVFAKMPNRKGEDECWCILDDAEKSKAGFDLFCNRSAPETTFYAYTSYRSNRDKWDKTVETYFPTSTEQARMRPKGKRIQGLHSLSAWQEWETLLATVDAKTARTLVVKARQYVDNRWKWLPLVGKNHLWATGTSGVPRTARYVGPVEGGPWIIFNPRFS